MRLISDSHFDIRQYYGNLVLLYPEGHSELISDLCGRLDVSGYVYHCCEIGPSMLMKGDGFRNTVKLLERCVCLIPVMNEELFEEKNRITRAMFWYFIGYIRAKLKESIVPYIPIKAQPTANGKVQKPDLLRGTPLQGIDIMYDVDTFMSKIPAKFATKLLCYDYYEDRTTNHYASKRIGFRCLSISFKIYEKAFQNAKRLWADFTDREKTDVQFDKFIENELLCGCRVVSFGTDNKLEPQMMVYRDEVHPYVQDYPKSLVGKKTYRRVTGADRKEKDIHAELIMDVLIPVHKLLGAYMKCYITTTEAECPIPILMALMEPDFCNGHVSKYKYTNFMNLDYWEKAYPNDIYVDKKLKRVYFSLNFKRNEPPQPADPALEVGATLDYIFPQ